MQDAGRIPEKTDAQIFETLMKIRQRDAAIYNPEAKFYESDAGETEDDGSGEDGAEHERKRKKKLKALKLKDVIHQQVGVLHVACAVAGYS